MQITIKLVYADKGERPVQLPDSVPIRALAPAIAKKLDLPQERLDGTVYLYHFLQDGNLLDDDKTLAELGIEEGEVVELVQERLAPQPPEEPPPAPNAAPNARPSLPPRQQRSRSANHNNNRRPRRSFVSRVVGCALMVMLLIACTCAAFLTLIYTELAADNEEPAINILNQTTTPQDESVVVVEVTRIFQPILEEQTIPLQLLQTPITNVVDMHYSQVGNALLWIDENRLYEFSLVTMSTAVLDYLDTDIEMMRVSSNGRYLTAVLSNNTLYWRDLQAPEERISNSNNDSIIDLEIDNNGSVVALNGLGFVTHYTPNLLTTTALGNIESYDLQLLPDSFNAYGLTETNGETVLEKYLVNASLIEPMYGSLNGVTYNFCAPFWLSNETNLLVTSCGEAAFYISTSESTDMDFAFALPEVTDIVAFADTTNALLFLQAEQPKSVLVWPLDESEPYEVAVEKGRNGRYIFTPHNEDTPALIIVSQDETNAYFVQITQLTK